MRYVVGFIFSPDLRRVWLIKKNRPEWQAGLLNGIGGKVENGETFAEAMVREAKEECGYEGEHWTQFAELLYPDAYLKFYWAIRFEGESLPVTKEDEPIEEWGVHELVWNEMVPNLKWLIPAAIAHINDPYKLILTGRHE